jgi:antitoxin component YwqK of YwqJK toxin-antitoxin module
MKEKQLFERLEKKYACANMTRMRDTLDYDSVLQDIEPSEIAGLNNSTLCKWYFKGEKAVFKEELSYMSGHFAGEYEEIELFIEFTYEGMKPKEKKEYNTLPWLYGKPNKPHGQFRSYDKGRLHSVEHARHGIEHGHEVYYRNREIREITNDRNGKRHGWSFLVEDNTKVRAILYRRGKMVKEIRI